MVYLYIVLMVLNPRYSLFSPLLSLILVAITVWYKHPMAAAAVGICGLFCAGIFFWTRWIPVTIDIGQPNHLTLRDATTSRTYETEDLAAIRQFGESLQNMKVNPGTTKMVPAYFLTFRSKTGVVGIRVTAHGTILRDVPASSVQDEFIPRNAGIQDLIGTIKRTP